ncbi:MAG: hypothetical protein FWD18_04495 [Micrococcales bacterium]|nr:hypothetical protein [Micrococcales bacterium]
MTALGLRIDQAGADAAAAAASRAAGAVPTTTPPDGSGCGSPQVAAQVSSLIGLVGAQLTLIRHQAGGLAANMGQVTSTFDRADATLATAARG